MINGDFIAALRQIEKEKEIPFETLVQTLEMALSKAYKKHYAMVGDVLVHIDVNKSGAMGKSPFNVSAQKIVVEQAVNTHAEISLREAREKHNKEAQLGELITVPVTQGSFGRIAAQTAQQVVVQRHTRGRAPQDLRRVQRARSARSSPASCQRREGGNVFDHPRASSMPSCRRQEQVDPASPTASTTASRYTCSMSETPRTGRRSSFRAPIRA